MSGDGATTGDGLAAETLAAMRPVCSCCGDAATCFGESEGDPPVYACDNCCGHGGEDGHCSPVAPGRVTVEETEHLRASITARMCERLSRREPDWNDLCSYLGAADLFVASPRLLATVIGQRAEIARLTAALDGVRREERERCARECEVIAGELSYDFRLRQGMHAAERCAKAIGALPDDATGSAT